MTALSMSRMAVPYVALAAACGVALVFAIQYSRREPPVDAKMASAAPAASTPASGPQSRESAALAAAEAQANAVVRGLTGSPLPAESGDGVPEFDVARIEPSGDAVIAGRTTPGATVELLRNGEVHDRAVADKSGQFVMVSPQASRRHLRSDAALQGSRRQADDVQAERCGRDRAKVNRRAGRGADNAEQAHRGAVAAGFFEADGWRSDCGGGRDRAGRQVPRERPRTRRRCGQALSERQFRCAGNGRRGWPVCGHDQ